MSLWQFLPGIFFWYLVTVAIETPVLIAGLSSRHSLKRKIAAGFWLTACSYPFVTLIFPPLLNPSEHWILYALVSETFAPLCECLLFWLAFGRGDGSTARFVVRDCLAIIAANITSFASGLIIQTILPG